MYADVKVVGRGVIVLGFKSLRWVIVREVNGMGGRNPRGQKS